MCYKIRNNDSPLYLYDTLVSFLREEYELNLRNQTEFRNSQIRFSLLLLNHGNKLSPQLRNAPTLNRFKQATKNQTIKPLKFYNAGCRILYIFHNKLRHRHKFTKTWWGRRLSTPGFLVTLVSTRLQW